MEDVAWKRVELSKPYDKWVNTWLLHVAWLTMLGLSWQFPLRGTSTLSELPFHIIGILNNVSYLSGHKLWSWPDLPRESPRTPPGRETSLVWSIIDVARIVDPIKRASDVLLPVL